MRFLFCSAVILLGVAASTDSREELRKSIARREFRKANGLEQADRKETGKELALEENEARLVFGGPQRPQRANALRGTALMKAENDAYLVRQELASEVENEAYLANGARGDRRPLQRTHMATQADFDAFHAAYMRDFRPDIPRGTAVRLPEGERFVKRVSHRRAFDVEVDAPELY